MGYSYGAHLGSGFVRHRTTPPCRRRSVPAAHARAELGEFLVDLRRAGVMRRNAAMFGRETERERNLEILKCLHLPIEPGECIGAETIRPGEAGAQMLDSKALQPTHRVVEAMILEMEPLADPECGRVACEPLGRELGGSVLAQQTHGEMPIISGAFGLLMAGRRRPCAWQVVEAVPMNARRTLR